MNTFVHSVGAQRAVSLRRWYVLISAIALSGCAALPERQSNAATSQIAVIENYFAALNRRDLLPLTAYVAPDFEWISIVGGERVLEVGSREELAAALRRHFQQDKTMRWSIESVSSVGDFLAVNERAEWIEDGRGNQRSTLGIYELHDGRIRRVIYFLSE